MASTRAFAGFVWVVLVTIFLVIIAGSVVRTTQSGMGCPDWPTCFGSAIPPTDTAQVMFQPNHTYKKGQFIIYNDSLKYAKEKFTSSITYSPENWKQYEKHNYAKFTVVNTWIEYINRLLGALLGLLILAQVVWGFIHYKKLNNIVLLSIGLVLLTGFQAWLGKTVVDSHLALLKITLHMFGALLMVFLSQYILFLIKGKQKVSAPTNVLGATYILGVLVVSQLIIGTDIRGQIDNLVEHSANINRSGWITLLNSSFYIHKTFAGLIAGLALYSTVLASTNKAASTLVKRVLWVVLLEVLVGFALAYLDFPKAAQPLHLLLASVMAALVFANVLKLQKLV